MKKNIIYISITLLIALSVLCFNTYQKQTAYEFVSSNKNLEMNAEIETSNLSSNLTEETTDIILIVDLKGAVKRPGVYEVPETFRVMDVIELAGGLLEEADDLQINLSQKITDEMVIYVATKGENLEFLNWDTDYPSNVDAHSQNISINKATKEELMTLPGIGSVKAEAIINYREEIGTFKSIDELLLVNGIGSKTFETIRELIKL